MLLHIAVASKKRMVVDGERGFPLFQFYRQSLPAIFAKFLPAILMIWREVTRAGNLRVALRILSLYELS